MNWNNCFVALLFCCLNVEAQDSNYEWPLDGPHTITGNYGELRPNHFHVGLDFSTNNKINVPVYAIENGYVSRIKVSAVGYGRSIYITHPDGKVSVYGHLNAYLPAIAAYVKKEQYARQSFEVDLKLSPDQFKVKKREMIAYSGNSGGSTGPHLHFEIRDEKTEVPLNPFEYYDIKDSIEPMIDRVAFYNLADTCSPKFIASFKVKKNKKDSLVLDKDSIVLQQGILGFAFSGYDQYYAKGNANNIFGARVYYDDKLVHAHRLDQIDFADARFVNEFGEQVEKLKYQKCFLPTLYPPNVYEKRPTKGRILLSDTNWHTLRLQVHDESGNERVIQFKFKTRKLNFYSAPSINSDCYVNCSQDFMVAKNKLQIFIPANTLYYSTGLIFENTLETTRKIMILPRDANLKSTSIVGFEIPMKLRDCKSKLVLNSGAGVCCPIIKRDSVFYSVKTLGSFLLDVDSGAPTIKCKVSPAKLNAAKGLKYIDFTIKDNLSDIGKYNLYLNDKWVLAEYDAKNDYLVYYFDENTPTGVLNFRLEVEDRVGNKSKLSLELKR
jgi:hypothetical protein